MWTPKPSTGFKRNTGQINGRKGYHTQRDKDTPISGNPLFFAETDIVNRGDIPDKKITIYICPILMLFSTGICYVATVRQKSRLQGYLVESVYTFPHFMVLHALSILSDTACMTREEEQKMRWLEKRKGWFDESVIGWGNKLWCMWGKEGIVVAEDSKEWETPTCFTIMLPL